MNSGRILVVAPDHDLRRSVTFALVAYGYSVVAEAVWPTEPDAQPYDCVVLDEHVLREQSGRPRGFLSGRGPIVLLAYSDTAASQLGFDAVVDMPLKGEAVVEAVVAVMSQARETTK